MTYKTIDYFRQRSQLTPSGCWQWTLYTYADGYGQCGIKKTTTTAHRAAFEALHQRPVKAGMHVHHTCYNPSCVNPAHLKEISARENILDSRTRTKAANNVKKPYCPRCANAYTTYNRNGTSIRRCKQCHNEYTRKKSGYYERRGMTPPPLPTLKDYR